MTVIVADVGGTNTRVGLASDGPVDRASVARFRNAEFAQLGDVLATYLAQRRLPAPQAVCVAIAGPVRHGIGRLTNRDWIVSSDELCRVTGAARAIVLNDLSAQGYAIDSVSVEPVLSRGRPAEMDPDETRLVIGIGTGFNAAPVYCRPGGLMVVPSECGHVTLPVWNETGRRLSGLLAEHHGFASVEDLLSGRGLPQSYRLLTGRTPPADTEALLAQAELQPDGPEAEMLALVIGTLGRVVGDLALTHLPFGGIILIGGLARALTVHFDTFGFGEAMCDKGRFSEFLAQFQVFAMTDDYAALDGCASFARRGATFVPR